MKITNRYNLPEPIVTALTKDEYTRGESNRSVTQLIGSPRIRILNAENEARVEEDVSALVWMVLGTAVHNMFEGSAENHSKYIPEERLFAEVDGWTISGAIDIQKSEDDNTVTVTDYKTTSVWSVIYGKKEWNTQLNFYAWLVEQQPKGAKVGKLQVCAILRDWKQRDADTKADYPQAPIMIIDIPLWSKRYRDDYVRGRVRIHQEAEFMRLTGDTLPLCTDDERWMKPTTFAVIKKGNKRAKRVLSSFEEAEAYIEQEELKGFLIHERKGEATRCKTYCKVAEFCDQWQEELKMIEKNGTG